METQAKRKFRSLSATLLADIQVTNVTKDFRQVLLRQTAPAPIPEGAGYNKINTIVTDKGYQIPATKSILFIESAYPIKLMFGGAILTIGNDNGGAFLNVGETPEAVLVSESDQVVNIIYY